MFLRQLKKTNRQSEKEKEFPYCTLEIQHKGFTFKSTHHCTQCHPLWIACYHPTRLSTYHHPLQIRHTEGLSLATPALPPSPKLRDKHLKDPIPVPAGMALRLSPPGNSSHRQRKNPSLSTFASTEIFNCILTGQTPAGVTTRS